MSLEARFTHRTWYLTALAVGWNHLALQQPSLETKSLCRLLRDEAVAELEAMGEANPFVGAPEPVMEIRVPNREIPVRFAERDYAAMLDAALTHFLAKAMKSWDTERGLAILDFIALGVSR